MTYKQIYGNLSPKQVNEILDALNIKPKKHYASNVRSLAKYTNKDKEYWKNTPFTRETFMDKYFPQKDVHEVVKTKHQNDELMQEIMIKETYEPLVDNDTGIGTEEILIDFPTFPDKYLQIRQSANNRIDAHRLDNTTTSIDNDPVQIYYSPRITSLKDVFDTLDRVYANEIKNGPFKLHFSWGCIYEDQTNGSFQFVDANPNIIKRSIPAIIDGPETLEAYKQYMINTIEEAKNATYISTKLHWISIVSVMFAVYRLNKAGARVAFLPKEILRNNCLVHYNEDNQLCFWAAYAAYKWQYDPDDIWKNGKEPPKRGKTKEYLTTIAKRYLREYYGFKDVKQIREYKGFNIVTELDKFTKWAKLDVQIFDYDQSSQHYKLFKSIKCEGLSEPVTNPPFNILLITSGAESHIMWIKDPESLAGVLICPKCRSYCYNKKGTMRNKAKFEEHVKNCKGKREKKLKLDLVSHPYCPHLWKTTYAALLANKEEEYWRPTLYYMTYDFETVEEKVDQILTDQTTLNAKIQPLSVALTVYSPNGMKTFFFSKKKSDTFVDDFIETLFEYYDEIYDANTIKTPTQTLKPKHVCVLGFNSSKFDMNILLPYLTNEKKGWTVSDLIGTMSNFKALRLTKDSKHICFLDALHYITPQTLREFCENFCTNDKVHLQKGFFPYEAINNENYMEVLDKSEPFKQSDFYSTLTSSGISDEDYKKYLEDCKNFKTRWDYLEYYNKLDTQAMIEPLNNLIEKTAKYKVDMLSNLSLSANSSNTKYALAYKDFNPYENYARQQVTTFQPTKRWWAFKIRAYNEQDKSKGRDISNNVTMADFDYFKNLFQTETCYICHEGFTNENTPTLDRIDNNIGHTKDNVKICCKYCNTVKSNRSEAEARLYVNLRKYCLLHNLPMTIIQEDVYHLLRQGITGGMSNVLHRLNIKGETPINHLEYDIDNDEVKSIDSDKYKVEHIVGIDFNSLYPSVYSSVEHPFIPYTGGKMWMPGSVEQAFSTTNLMLKKRALYIIKRRDTLFVAEVKGHIPKEYWNEFINLPPIWRNVEVNLSKEVLGENMYNYLKENGMSTDGKSKKLTMLMSTHPECATDTESGYMSFSSYYLWFLMDRCHFVIEDIRYIVTFTKHIGFNSFVTTFMEERQKAIHDDNKGMEMFCKISLNGSYGYDGMNAEKWTKSKIYNKDRTFTTQLSDLFLATRKISDDSFIVEQESKTYGCNTCLQEAFFTLDNAKYWYLNFVYNFMEKAFDMSRIHYVEGDTDSMYWAISGSSFQDVIKDKDFYDKNAKYFFPDETLPEGSLEKIASQKKLLGLCIEREGDNCVALAPKCYTIWTDNKDVVALKIKGVKKTGNDFSYQDYLDVLNNRSKKVGKNVNLQLNDGVMSKMTVFKNALTCAHTKMKVLENQSCVPFL